MCAKVFTCRLLTALLLLAPMGACGRADSEAAAQSAEDRVVACNLITAAEADAILGEATEERDSYSSDNASVCTLPGSRDAATLRVWQPFHGGGATAAEWVARLKAERADAMEQETDPDLKKALEDVRIVAYDGLGVAAAREDIMGQVALHALKGGVGGVYLSVYASELDVAHRIAQAALAKIH